MSNPANNAIREAFDRMQDAVDAAHDRADEKCARAFDAGGTTDELIAERACIDEIEDAFKTLRVDIERIIGER